MNKAFIAISLLAILAIGAAVTLLLWREPHVVVISSGEETQQARLESLLAASGIRYRKDDDNRVTVPESDLMNVRQLAADRGVITPPRDGLETFQGDNYGATEFVQRVNYQRALQAEIERTIIKLDGVIDARVHMRQPKRTTFFRKDEVTRASILVKLDDFVELATLAPSIAQIAAGAVDGLDAKDVQIVADNGAISAGDGALTGLGGGPNARRQASLEQHYRDAIQTVLQPLYPADQVGIIVTVEIDHRERSYRRENVPIASSRVTTRSTKTSSEPGVSRDAEDRTDEYSYGVESESIETPAGSILRIGIGVMIADRLEASEIENIEQLIASATGISPDRGDTVKVISYSPETYAVEDSVAARPPPAAAIEITKPAASRASQTPARLTRSASMGPTGGLSALLAQPRTAVLPLAAGLTVGLAVLLALALRRRITRQRMTRDVLSWVEGGAL